MLGAFFSSAIEHGEKLKMGTKKIKQQKKQSIS